jgi:CTP:molybdopterin cytidylyltransferase MocA
MTRIAGVVLAAGAGTRMGRNKMLLDLDGEPLVRRAARVALEAQLEPVIVVVGPEGDLVWQAVADLGVRRARAPGPNDSISVSLHAGLGELNSTAGGIVVLLGDMVGTTAPMIRELVTRHAASGAWCVASRYGDVVAPPLLFDAQALPLLRSYTGDRLGQRFMASGAGPVVFADWPSSLLQDIDTPEDLRRLRDHSASRSGAS